MADNSSLGPNNEPRRSLFSGRDKLKPVKAPPPPEKPKKRKERGGGLVGVLSAVLTVGVLILFAAGMGVGYVKNMATAAGPLQSDRSVVIERGMGAEEIAELLEREGVITRPALFQAMAMSQLYGKLKAGEFLFKREASLEDVIDTIANGRAIEHSITIPEGLTSEQIVQRLNESDLLLGSIASIPAEGSLLPDTYKIQRGTSRDQLIARMQRDQKRILADVWAKKAKDLPIRTQLDLVTLASIVEKETGKSDERTRVASVFVNRLQKNMRLQSDPTIIYGLVSGKGSLGRAITQADITSNTPYNTYVINGLPPGPIANPGRASLEAAANPSRTKDLFFVADGTGGHAFAETLEQHNRNVVRWRQIEAAAKGVGTTTPGTGFAPVPPAPPLPNAPRGDGGDIVPPEVDQRIASIPASQNLAGRDATEGTPVDPLALTNFDLNAGHEVPSVQYRTRAEIARFSIPQRLKLADPKTVPPLPARSGTGDPSLPENSSGYDLNSAQTIPDLPKRTKAELQTASAGAGMPVGSDAVGTQPRRRIDASEGTRVDPLSKANRAFDLNSSKSVPTLR